MVDWWLAGEKGRSLAATSGTEFKELLEIGNIPNMFTAIVPAAQAEDLASRCEQAVIAGWEGITNAVREEVEAAYKARGSEGGEIASWKEIWDRQGKTFIHNQGIFRVICPWGDHFEDVLAVGANGNQSPFMTDFVSIIRRMKEAGHEPHIGMATHLLSSFAGRELTARKNMRDFDQSEFGEPGFKCSLCGKWEALHPSSLGGYADMKSFWTNLSQIGRKKDNIKLVGRIRRGDMLCSICLTRRLALESVFEESMKIDHHQFPSTAGITTAAYRGELLRACADSPELAEKLKNFQSEVTKLIRDGFFPWPANSTPYLQECGRKSGLEEKIWKGFLKIDGDWLSPDAYDKQLMHESEAITEDSLKTCRKATADLLTEAKKSDNAPSGLPPGYYAILALDGDKMGDWVTGANKRAPGLKWLIHPDIRNSQDIASILPSDFLRPAGPAMQLALSDGLKHFSLNFARDIVEKDHAGKLIYAGGDDVLAFLPTAHLFSTMHALYRYFRGAADGYDVKNGDLFRLSGGVHPNKGGDFHHEGVTPSMGVIIVHHSYPLYHAMAEAQKVLKDVAKKKLGRNAFAIRLLRRSGEPTEGGFKFNSNVESSEGDMIVLLMDIMKLIRQDVLSQRLPYALGMHRWAVCGNQDKEDMELNEARRAELARITARHIKAPNLSSHEKQDIQKLVLRLFDAIAEANENPINPWDMTARLLLILRFMAGKES
jgi:CRISPR-associated protein Cmr2